ncbi:MAG: hypothetical protein AAB250_18975 [Bdellovibrionota bacterium]
MLPKKGTEAYAKFAENLTPSMRRDLEDVGSWTTGRLEQSRVAVPVARMPENDLASIAKPRSHVPLPSVAKDGSLFFPDHIQLADGLPRTSETFHVRMMAIKDSGSGSYELPSQLEYLRPFVDRAFALERSRDPEHFKNRLAFIQVDASWVEPGQLQPRPGKVTDQSASREARKGAHVDGFMTERFFELQEDVTYSMSTGFDPATGRHGDAIPTEFFDRAFPLPSGINHTQARPLLDAMANEVAPLSMPQGFINRMSSRVVHRVGIANKRTYRTFVKIKFTDETFNQVANTVNGRYRAQMSGGIGFEPSAIYDHWRDRGIPIVERTTLPTEGVIDAADRERFETRRRIGAP